MDDLSILSDDVLWRRINPDWIVPDHNRGGRRITSQAFQNLRNDQLSVLHAKTVESDGRTATDVLEGFEDYALAGVTAGFARELGQAIVRAPEPEEKAHCHMIGRKTQSVKKKLAKEASSAWVVQPSEN